MNPAVILRKNRQLNVYNFKGNRGVISKAAVAVLNEFWFKYLPFANIILLSWSIGCISYEQLCHS